MEGTKDGYQFAYQFQELDIMFRLRYITECEYLHDSSSRRASPVLPAHGETIGNEVGSEKARKRMVLL